MLSITSLLLETNLCKLKPPSLAHLFHIFDELHGFAYGWYGLETVVYIEVIPDKVSCRGTNFLLIVVGHNVYEVHCGN